MSKIRDFETIETEDSVHKNKSEVLTVEHDDKTYAFEIRDLSYNERKSLESDLIDIDPRTQALDLNIDEYTIEYLKKAVVNSNVEKFHVFVKNMPPKVGNRLEEYVDDPVNTDESDEGN